MPPEASPDPADLARVDALADGDAAGLMRGLIEEGVLPAARAWELATIFSRDRIIEVFDWTEGTYDLGPAKVPPETAWVRDVRLPGLILEGIRRMGNFAVIEAGLPGPDEKLRLLAPRDGESVALAPHERYVLSASAGADRLGEVLRISPLGGKETKRALFALLVLGLLAPEKGDRPSSEYSLGDMDRLFEAFNDRCSFIFKYISKELGPVALNVYRKIPGRGPGPDRPGLPILPGEAGREDRAPNPPPEEPGRLERRGQEEPPPELRRDPGRRGPGRQADPRERARIRPGQGSGAAGGPAVNRKQLAGLLFLVSALALWLLGKIGL